MYINCALSVVGVNLEHGLHTARWKGNGEPTILISPNSIITGDVGGILFMMRPTPETRMAENRTEQIGIEQATIVAVLAPQGPF